MTPRTAPCLGCGLPLWQDPIPAMDGHTVLWLPRLCATCKTANADQRADWERAAHPEQEER